MDIGIGLLNYTDNTEQKYAQIGYWSMRLNRFFPVLTDARIALLDFNESPIDPRNDWIQFQTYARLKESPDEVVCVPLGALRYYCRRSQKAVNISYGNASNWNRCNQSKVAVSRVPLSMGRQLSENATLVLDKRVTLYYRSDGTSCARTYHIT